MVASVSYFERRDPLTMGTAFFWCMHQGLETPFLCCFLFTLVAHPVTFYVCMFVVNVFNVNYSLQTAAVSGERVKKSTKSKADQRLVCYSSDDDDEDDEKTKEVRYCSGSASKIIGVCFLLDYLCPSNISATSGAATMLACTL